jgi:predicted transposase/invertase (TIGR01784 family)
MESDKKGKRQLVSFDWAIKRLLRNKVDFDIVNGFLSELLGRQVKITAVLESESNQEDITDKFDRVDVLVEDESGEIIIIELQFILETDYFQRMLYGTSRSVVERMVKGEPYMSIKKVYSINIVYFDLGQGKDYVYHGKTDFRGLHHQDILQLSKKQRDVFGKIEAGDLYPEYYVLKINNFDDMAKNTLDEWIYFLKNDRIEKNFSAQGLLRARDMLDYNRLSSAERKVFDRAQSIKEHHLCQLASAKDEGRMEAKTESDKVIEEQRNAIEEKDKALEKKDKTIEEKEKAIEEKDKTIEEKDKALEELLQEIAKLKQSLNNN